MMEGAAAKQDDSDLALRPGLSFSHKPRWYNIYFPIGIDAPPASTFTDILLASLLPGKTSDNISKPAVSGGRCVEKRLWHAGTPSNTPMVRQAATSSDARRKIGQWLIQGVAPVISAVPIPTMSPLRSSDWLHVHRAWKFSLRRRKIPSKTGPRSLA